MEKIIIIGGGIGGLTVAHELSKYKKYEIHIYEKNNIIGGMAKSRRDNDGCATEYSWRVYFGFYYNLFRILKEIPTENNKTVYDNLTIYKHLNIEDTNLNFIDKLKLIYVLSNGVTSCDSRLKKLDTIAWYDYIKNISKSNILRLISPWFGIDRYKGSTYTIIKSGIEQQIIKKYFNFNNTYKDYVLKYPTNEGFFDYWEKHLIKQNVYFHKNCELTKVNIVNNKIKYLIIRNNITSIQDTIYCEPTDKVIFSMPVEVLSTIVLKTPELNIGSLQHIHLLTKIARQDLISVQIFFNKKILIGGDRNAFLIIDSPWDLIILLYDEIYKDTKLCNKIENVKGGWSVVICTTYVPGIVYKRSMMECTYEEIKIEIFQQIMNSSKLKEIIYKYNSFNLDKNMFIHWSPLYETYHFDKNLNRMVNKEPKFSNNVNTLNLRPSVKTHINNLYISTAYCSEALDIFCMEGAATSGIIVSKLINQNVITPNYHQKRPTIFAPMRFIDSISYSIGLPNICPLIILILIFILFYFLIKKIYKIVSNQNELIKMYLIKTN